MKIIKVYLLLILLFIGYQSVAQSDSIYAVVSGDNVTLWHTAAWRNCGALYLMGIDLLDHHIDWYQVDTGISAYCYCTFDLSVTFGPLEPGDYNVDVYFTESYSEDSIFAGSTTFSIGKSKHDLTSGIISQYQSECYTIGVNDSNVQQETSCKFYPVPVKEGAFLYMTAFPNGKNMLLEILTITGKVIYSKHYETVAVIQDQWMKNELFPVTGIYLLKLTIGDKVFIRKIPVIN